jgi:hypothetical protein
MLPQGRVRNHQPPRACVWAAAAVSATAAPAPFCAASHAGNPTFVWHACYGASDGCQAHVCVCVLHRRGGNIQQQVHVWRICLASPGGRGGPSAGRLPAGRPVELLCVRSTCRSAAICSPLLVCFFLPCGPV